MIDVAANWSTDNTTIFLFILELNSLKLVLISRLPLISFDELFFD